MQGKIRRRGPNKSWLDIIRDDIKEYKKTEDKAQNRSVWHMKTKAGPIGPTTRRRPIGEKIECFPVVYN